MISNTGTVYDIYGDEGTCGDPPYEKSNMSDQASKDASPCKSCTDHDDQPSVWNGNPVGDTEGFFYEVDDRPYGIF